MKNYGIKGKIILIFTLYIFFLLFLYVSFPNKIPADWIIVWQLILALYVFVGFEFYPRKKMQITFIYIFIFHVLFSFCQRNLLETYVHNPYCINPIDSYWYTEMFEGLSKRSFSQSLSYLRNMSQYYTHMKFDDYGFIFIGTFIYKLGINEMTQMTLLLVTNSIVHVAGCYYLYKFSSFFLSQKNAANLSILWGVFPYTLFCSVSYAKENFFILVILLSFYFLYKYILVKKRIYLFYFYLFTTFTIFFRSIIPFTILAALAFYWLLNSKIKKYLIVIILTGIVCSLLILPIFMELLGVSGGYEHILMVSSNRTEHRTDSLQQAFIVNALAMFLGPFPSIIGESLKNEYYYNILHFIKSILSFYYLIGLWTIVKNKVYQLYPLLAYIFIATSMCIVYAIAFDIRYQYPYFPFILFISMYGYENRKSIKIKSYAFSVYCIAVLFVIYMYNLRE